VYNLVPDFRDPARMSSILSAFLAPGQASPQLERHSRPRTSSRSMDSTVGHIVGSTVGNAAEDVVAPISVVKRT
jgi:hypothetical protein